MKSTVPTLLMVTTHPAQTYVDLYRRLARSEAIRFKVLFAHDTTQGFFDPDFTVDVKWDNDLVTGYEHIFLSPWRGWQIRLRRRAGIRVEIPSAKMLMETWRQIRRVQPDVILLPGHGNLWYLFVWALCGIFGIPYILRGTGVLRRPDASLTSRVVGRIARAQVGRAAAFCYIGLNNYFFGVINGARFFSFSPYAVQSERFVGARLHGESLRTRRLHHGLNPDIPIAVFSGKLQPWKRPQDLIYAVTEASIPFQAIIIGEGPMRNDLENLAAEVGAMVHFAGFVNQLEIPHWYSLGDVFVLPSSRETWGLSVNEALASGLTPVVSDAVPSWPDLAAGAGFVFPVGETQRLSECIVNAVEMRSNPHHIRVLDSLTSRYSVDNAALGIESAVVHAVK